MGKTIFCKCGEKLSFWEIEFETLECYTCRQKEYVNERIKIISDGLKKQPGAKLNIDAKNIILQARILKLLNKSDEKLFSQVNEVKGASR